MEETARVGHQQEGRGDDQENVFARDQRQIEALESGGCTVGGMVQGGKGQIRHGPRACGW